MRVFRPRARRGEVDEPNVADAQEGAEWPPVPEGEEFHVETHLPVEPEHVENTRVEVLEVGVGDSMEINVAGCVKPDKDRDSAGSRGPVTEGMSSKGHLAAVLLQEKKINGSATPSSTKTRHLPSLGPRRAHVKGAAAWSVVFSAPEMKVSVRLSPLKLKRQWSEFASYVRYLVSVLGKPEE